MKPASGVLFFVAGSSAMMIQKALQSLDYLNLLNVQELPRNIRKVLEFSAEGLLFSNINFFGDFYKFDDGDEEKTEFEEKNRSKRLLSESSTFCRTHNILKKEDLSCLGWNNTGLFFIQFSIIFILFSLFWYLGILARRSEKKAWKQPENLARIDKMFEEINQKNSQVKVKRNFLFKVIFFVEAVLNFEFLMTFLLTIELDILIGAFTGLKYSRFDTGVNIFNMVLSLLVVIFYGLITVTITLKIWFYSRKSKDWIEKLHRGSILRKWEFL